MCAPGLRDSSGVVVRAVNVPGLEGGRAGELVGQCLKDAGCRMAEWRRRITEQVVEVTDTYAAAMDWWKDSAARGRLLALSMGTGIGACVLDEVEGKPRALVVTGSGPGQIGQMDVTVLEWVGGMVPPPPVGPDGGRGTLEGYMGLPALRERFGTDEKMWGRELRLMRLDRAPLSALVKALRIAQAIYLPERIVLLGGVGLALADRTAELRAVVSAGLTPLARKGWTLEAGRTNFHAARGAARLAAEGGAAVGRV